MRPSRHVEEHTPQLLVYGQHFHLRAQDVYSVDQGEKLRWWSQSSEYWSWSAGVFISIFTQCREEACLEDWFDVSNMTKGDVTLPDFPLLFRVLPIMLFAYMMAFLDKQTLNYAALMGIREDLHLVGTQYNWSSSIFYFGYLIFSCVPLPESNVVCNSLLQATQHHCWWSNFHLENIFPQSCQ